MIGTMSNRILIVDDSLNARVDAFPTKPFDDEKVLGELSRLIA